MSSSEKNTKIDLIDTPKKIRKKIGKAFCPERDINSGLFQFFEKVIWKILRVRSEPILFSRPVEYGGNIECKNIDSLKQAILEGNIHPADFKQFISQFLINLLEPVRNLTDLEQFKKICKKSY